MYDIRSAMLNIGIVFTPGKFKINLEKTWKTPGILVNLRSTDPGSTISWKYILKPASHAEEQTYFNFLSETYVKKINTNKPSPIDPFINVKLIIIHCYII